MHPRHSPARRPPAPCCFPRIPSSGRPLQRDAPSWCPPRRTRRMRPGRRGACHRDRRAGWLLCAPAGWATSMGPGGFYGRSCGRVGLDGKRAGAEGLCLKLYASAQGSQQRSSRQRTGCHSQCRRSRSLNPGKQRCTENSRRQLPDGSRQATRLLHEPLELGGQGCRCRGCGPPAHVLLQNAIPASVLGVRSWTTGGGGLWLAGKRVDKRWMTFCCGPARADASARHPLTSTSVRAMASTAQ